MYKSVRSVSVLWMKISDRCVATMMAFQRTKDSTASIQVLPSLNKQKTRKHGSATKHLKTTWCVVQLRRTDAGDIRSQVSSRFMAFAQRHGTPAITSHALGQVDAEDISELKRDGHRNPVSSKSSP